MLAVRRHLVWLALLASCGGGEVDSPSSTPEVTAEAGTSVRMDPTLAGGFFSSPFPSEARRRADGAVDVTGFPNGTDADLVRKVLAVLDGETGFGTTSGIFFSLSGPLSDGALPDRSTSTAKDASVYLVSVDPSAPDRGKRYPISVVYREDAGPFGGANLLSLLPEQGIPLRPRTRYAAVVTRALRDRAGAALVPAATLRTLIEGGTPVGMPVAAAAVHREAIAELKTQGVDASALAGLAVFVTGDPTRDLGRVRDDLLARKTPVPEAPFAPKEVFPDYCVYETTIRMPTYQEGKPPYQETGGGFRFDAAGKPIVQGEELASFVVTVPRSPMPAAGYPAVVFSRTGGGGERPLVDRGPQAMSGGPAIKPGTGPAMGFARAGFAGTSIDGPHGGLRNITHGDEQFLMFNVTNPIALRDNVRQSALELALAAHILPEVTIDVSGCPGASVPGGGPARFDAGTLALMGHSMGATIAPLSLAIEPRLRAVILSGAGGSWIANVIDKKKPVAVRGFAEILLKLVTGDYRLHTHDPLLSMLQWAGEAADPPVYGRMIIAEPPPGSPPRHVLMLQGIVDHYILPSIANATTLSFGLDLAGGSLDAVTPELASFTTAATVVPLVGRRTIELPVAGNLTGPGGEKVTAVVVQHKEDGIEDGHEVAFQTAAPKRQYRCFLASLKQGTPVVPTRGGEDDPCEGP